ncbi:hypothetical protein OIU76_016737 [Salix suchowensis]|uniref:Uncharacterized protein n=1 Tax=Salix suchowensis TaxID=1278906 RepID=A0ABQ9AST4_9ROSI|nr:hypothetical protein OIU77_003969 [Salix suchowensis]KAJ6380139.1 hypothetical protein OIU76_016737 [Salix suchowensis]KAJ6384412.1 hypothetical protein OIU78_027674 [Salix suchowensis]
MVIISFIFTKLQTPFSNNSIRLISETEVNCSVKINFYINPIINERLNHCSYLSFKLVPFPRSVRGGIDISFSCSIS